MNAQSKLFSILDKVDSSNNYAMGQVRAGLAKHGQAWFALDQFAGRGQRTKTWLSSPGQNIILSLAVKPNKVFTEKPFLLSMLTANVCRAFLADYAGEEIRIKWPNDIYWSDRKTAGILIENVFKGKDWDFAVIGIGMNINQTEFPEEAVKAVSLKNITGQNYDPVAMGRKLQQQLMETLDNVKGNTTTLIQIYNESLYRKDERIKLRKENAVFETTVRGVNEFGQLITEDAMERRFEFGEVSWVV